jgi:hypothetical protein
MRVGNCLARRLADIDADVVSVRLPIHLDVPAYWHHQRPDGGLFFGC